MAGPGTPPVAPSEGHAQSPATAQLVGGAGAPIPTVGSGTTAAPPTQNDGGASPDPSLGSVELDGTRQFGYALKAGPGIAIAQSGKALQIAVDQSGGGSIPVTDLIPGPADTVLDTNSAGTAVQWAKVVNANVATNAAIDQSKIAIAPTVTIPVLDIDWSQGSVFQQTLQAGLNTFTFSNTTDGQTIVVKLTGAASTVGWPGGVQWTGGTDPTQTASGTDVYTFVDIGGTIYGSVIQDFS